MRKEVFIIFILGITLGSIIAYGAWRANSALNQKPYSTSFNSTQAPTTSTKNENKNQINTGTGLTIATPENFDVFVDDETALTGITNPGSKVIISDENRDQIMDPDGQGGFETQVTFDAGINTILVGSVGKNDGLIKKSLVVVYSSELANSLAGPDKKEDAEATSSIDRKVEEKLELARKSPKALLGTITDKTNNTLQIKNTTGGIDQVSVTEITTYAKSGKTSQAAKYDDLAIGDFVVAMGIKNASGVFESLRILITDPLKEPDRQIFSGTVKAIVKKTLTITTSEGEEKTLIFPAKWTGPEIKGFEEGQKVIGVLLKDDKLGLTITTIDFLNAE